MMGLSSVMVHIVPYLESVEFTTTIAATIVMGVTLCAIIGRVGFGFAGDFTNKRYLIAFAIALQTVGLFIFSLIDADRVWLIIPFLLTYSPGQAGPIILRMPLQADYFGRKSYGTIFGLMMSISMLGGLVSPVIAGWIFDTSGSYHQAWQLFALLTIPAIPLILLAKPPKLRK
jgi:MFS family permease